MPCRFPSNSGNTGDCSSKPRYWRRTSGSSRPVRCWPPRRETAPQAARITAALLARAMEAERKGNFVRAAILRTKAGGTTPLDHHELLEVGTRSAMGKLVHELAGVLEWNEGRQREWRH